jgi:O-antigen ligase
MIAALHAPGRREFAAGLTLGFYAALVALAPGIRAQAALSAPLAVVPLAWLILKTPKAWLALFFGSALLLPPLPIQLGDSGPHIALLFAAAGLAIGWLRLSEWRFEIDSLTGSILAFLAIVLASVSMALLYSGWSIASASFARALLMGISVYVFLYVGRGPGRMQAAQGFQWLRWLFWAAVLSAAFACLDFYFQFPAPAGYGQQFIWLDTGVFRRAQGVFYEASTLGNLCAFFLVMIAVMLFRRGRAFFSPVALVVGGSAFSAALILSYSRASLVNLAVALAVLVWIHRDRIRWRRVAAGALLFASSLAVLGMASPVFSRAYWQRLGAAFQYFSESPNMVLSGRLESWRTLLHFLANNPWHMLLGVGYKTLPYSDFIGTTAIGDNTYLTLLAETGVIGLAALVALNAAILMRAYRAARSTDDLRSFCGAWMLCFWSGQVAQMFSADLLTYWRILPVYFFVLALAA